MHAHTHSRTPLEALMNLDVIGTGAELRGGEAEGDEDRWIKSKGGHEKEGGCGGILFSGLTK